MARRVFSCAGSRYLLALVPLLLGAIPAYAQIVITPSTPPAVNAGQSINFTASVVEGGGVKWSCVNNGNGGTCLGSINSSTGVYTAPAHITSNQSYGGFQLLPNDHIYNTRIDSLPVNANSATWIAGAGTVPFSYQFAFPINYMNGSTPTGSLVFTDSPGNNGIFQLPAYPLARRETGWFAGACCDRH